jgi:hypothetical protein
VSLQPRRRWWRVVQLATHDRKLMVNHAPIERHVDLLKLMLNKCSCGVEVSSWTIALNGQLDGDGPVGGIAHESRVSRCGRVSIIDDDALGVKRRMSSALSLSCWVRSLP